MGTSPLTTSGNRPRVTFVAEDIRQTWVCAWGALLDG